VPKPEAKKEQLRKERNAALNDASSLRDEVFKLEQELKFERGQAEKTLKWARQTEMEKNSAEANVKLLQVRLDEARGAARVEEELKFAAEAKAFQFAKEAEDLKAQTLSF